MVQNLASVRKPVHNKTMGIEIECFLERSRYLDEQYKHHRFFYADNDGSVTPSDYEFKSFEFVSQPLPYSWLCKEIDWLYKKFKWRFNDSCGIHVHVSKSWFSMKRAERLYAALRRFSVQQMIDLFGRYSYDYANIRCVFGNSRYCAINVNNSSTIEFRMWAAGDGSWAKECLRRNKLMVEHRGKYDYETLLELFTNPTAESAGNKRIKKEKRACETQIQNEHQTTTNLSNEESSLVETFRAAIAAEDAVFVRRSAAAPRRSTLIPNPCAELLREHGG